MYAGMGSEHLRISFMKLSGKNGNLFFMFMGVEDFVGVGICRVLYELFFLDVLIFGFAGGIGCVDVGC